MLSELLAARQIPPSGIYCVPVVSRILGITQTSVRRLIRLGLLKAIHRRRSIIGITHPALVVYLSSGDDAPLFAVVKQQDPNASVTSLGAEVEHA